MSSEDSECGGVVDCCEAEVIDSGVWVTEVFGGDTVIATLGAVSLLLLGLVLGVDERCNLI